LTTVGHTSSNTGAVTTFASLNKIVAAELSNGNAGITLGYNAAVVAGTADAASLTLSNQTGGTFTSTGIETLNVVSNTSANTVTLAAGPTAVNVSGAARLTLGTLDTGVTTLNASASTGGVVATLSTLATAVITGSTGNDTFTAGTNMSGVGAVNGGDGIDTLVSTADALIAAATDGARFTNFETLSISSTALGADATRDQNMSQIAGITTMNVTSARVDGTAGDTTHGVVLSNVGATTNTLNITGLANADTTAGDDLTVTVTATRATNTSADAMTVNLGTTTATSGSTQLAVAGAGAGVILNVSLANEESITLNSLGGTTGTNFVAAITNGAATSVTATGARALSVGAMSSTVVTKIDASAMTGAFIMGTNAGAVASTISGGTGADTLTGGSAADNISGGAGNDSITGAAGADVITGGDGQDTIVGGAGIDNLSGGIGNDTFSVTTIGDFTNLASAEVVSGGDGNDNLSFAENVALTIAATDLTGINSVETITINGTANAGSITLTDAVYTANGATTLSIVDGDLTQGTLTVNASALTATNGVVTTGNTSTGVNDSLVGGAGADSFLFSTTTGLQAGDTVTGGAGTDTIILSATAAAVTGVLTATTLVENVTTTGTAGDVIITVGADTVIAAAGTLTVNASSVTNNAFDLNYDGSAVTTVTKVQNVTGTAGADTIVGGSGNDIIVGGEGADSITGGVGIDNLSGDAGNDTFVVAASGAGFVGLTTAETVSGGAGNDILQFAAGAVVIAAADLVSVSGIETIQILNTTETAGLTLTDAFYTTNGATTLAVNSSTATTGVLTLAASTLSAANSVQLNMSATTNNALNVINLGAGNDTVTVDLIALDSGTIAGGAGTDTLVISANTGAAAITAAATVTGFETVSFLAAGVAGTFNFVVNDANVAAAATQTINGSNLTGTLLWNGAAELDGKFSITGGTGADSLTGGSLVDTISGGAGADVITGGLGADVLAGGNGADTFVYATVAQSNGTNTDSISDFTTGTDKLQVTLNYSTLTSALDINAVRASAGVAGTALAQDTLSGQRGQYVYDTSTSSLFINFNNDNLLTTSDYKIGINAASTATASIVEGDINFVITGGTVGDVIVAGGGADTITGGLGADIITGGAGADSIILTEAVSSADVVVFGATAAANGVDTITGFATTVDKLNVDAFGTATTLTTVTGTQTNTVNNVYFLGGQAAGAADSIANSVTALAAAGTWTDAAVLSYIIIADDNSSAVYSYTGDAAGNDFTAGEFTLMGTVDAVLVAGDIIFA
jgi:Ca2+-binding RTX toxin-like protein